MDLLALLAAKNADERDAHSFKGVLSNYYHGASQEFHKLAVELEQLGLDGIFDKYNIS